MLPSLLPFVPSTQVNPLTFLSSPLPSPSLIFSHSLSLPSSSVDEEGESQGKQSSRSQLQVTPSASVAVPARSISYDPSRRVSDSPPKAVKNPLKFNRRTSEPVLDQYEEPSKKSGGQKKKSLFKRRPGTQYNPIPETDSSEFSFIPNRSPILSRKKPASSTSVPDAAVSNGVSSEAASAARKPLVRPVSSPRVAPKVPLLPPNSGSRSPNPGVKRRPPPPPPPPYARTHGRKGLTDLLERKDSVEKAKERSSSESSSAQETSPSATPPLAFKASKVEEEDREDELREESDSPKALGGSNSMEELLKNLEEFDAVQDTFGKEGPKPGERDYATIPRSELPEKRVSESEVEGRSASPSVPKIDVTAEAESLPKPLPARPQRRPKPKVQPARPQPPSVLKPSPPPKPVENGVDREEGLQPTPPPRTRRHRSSQKAKETKDQASEKREGNGGGVGDKEGKVKTPPEESRPKKPAPKWHAPPPPPGKPTTGMDKKRKHRSMLEPYTMQQQPLSAPTSRTGSPDDQ